MGRLTNSKKIKLLKIEKARAELELEFRRGLITEYDILKLISRNVNYGIRKKDENLSYKNSVLKNIFNCPFLLCDQDFLDINIKKLLPSFLDARYSVEKDMLKYYYDSSFISQEEYNNELEELKFCFYESSKDGKNILKTGHVINVKDNVIRQR